MHSGVAFQSSIEYCLLECLAKLRGRKLSHPFKIFNFFLLLLV